MPACACRLCLSGALAGLFFAALACLRATPHLKVMLFACQAAPPHKRADGRTAGFVAGRLSNM
ncbi:exported hypothetical protein [Paraburkholderia tropica]|nr:exported hypothetical protein [Paraburkholderia tropica]